jgi:hypothetical protein
MTNLVSFAASPQGVPSPTGYHRAQTPDPIRCYDEFRTHGREPATECVAGGTWGILQLEAERACSLSSKVTYVRF